MFPRAGRIRPIRKCANIVGSVTLRDLPYLLRRTLMASIDDGLFSIAKGAAYSALLSFFPVLTSAATIFVQVRADYVQQNMAEFLSEILPPGTEEVVMEQFRSRGQ